MDISELTKQAPGIAGVIVIVIVFLQAQSKRDTAFLGMLQARDDAFAKILHSLTSEVGAIGNLLTSHDAWEKGMSVKPLRRKKAKGRQKSE
jgi:hypothetical protein